MGWNFTESKTMIKPIFSSVFAMMLVVGCGADKPAEPAAEQDVAAEPAAPVEPAALPPVAANAEAISEAVDNAFRDPNNVARDASRNPLETLSFFGVTDTQTVLEIYPGGGWYAEILVPLLREKGQYIGAIINPASASNERAQAYYAEQGANLRAKFAANEEAYGQPTLIEVDVNNPVFGEPGTVDTVLTFRNVHNWLMAGTAPAMFEGFYDVLKPGGVLGVVEHRASADVPEGDRSGYVGQAQTIALAEAAGFVLEEASEINANPADTKDHEAGVWSLPPTLRLGDKDREKYEAIGESDRMTLRFRKPL